MICGKPSAYCAHSPTIDHLHLLAPRIVRLVVEVDVQHAELRTALPVAQAHPVAVTGAHRVPRTAARGKRSFRQPVAARRDELVALFAEENHVLADKVITLGIGVHLRTCESVSDIIREFLLEIVIRIVNHLLHADHIGSVHADRLQAGVAAVLPAASCGIIFGQSRDADVAGHDACGPLPGRRTRRNCGDRRNAGRKTACQTQHKALLHRFKS